MEVDQGLNPFEIRAGLKRCGPTKPPKPTSLNPFEIRAGLKPYCLLSLLRSFVLIPLKSGLV